VPASPFIKDSIKAFSELGPSSQFNQTSRSRKSTERQRFAMIDLEPAGGRRPLPFRQLLADEIPLIIEGMQKEGATDMDIRKKVQEMKE